MQTTGQSVYAWTKTGTLVSGYPISFNSLMNNASPAVSGTNGASSVAFSDPRCYYNEFIGSGRFIVVVGHGNAQSTTAPHILVSSGNDLSTATWASGQPDTTGSVIGDVVPHIGYNKWWTAFTAFLNTSQYRTIVIPNADLSGGTLNFSHSVSADIDLETWPAIDHSTSTLVGDPLYITGRGTPAQNCTNCAVTFHTRSITGADSTHPSVSGLTDITSGVSITYDTPLAAGPNQPSTAIPIKITESHRMQRINQYKDGSGNVHLVGVLNDGPRTETWNGWVGFDVDPVGTTVRAAKRVFGGSTDVYMFNDVDIDSSQRFVVCGGRYSATLNASIVCWWSPDDWTTVNGPYTIFSGTAAYPGNNVNNGGWGTYGAIQTDPSDGTKIWTTNQYGGNTTQYVWSTRVNQVSLNCAITTTTLPNGTQNVSYSQTVVTSNCISPTFAVTVGSLPTGLSLNSSSGVISGTPTGTGTSSFTVGVTDTAGNPTQALSILINPSMTQTGARSAGILVSGSIVH